nr:interleukin-24-like [Zootoca vivipara]
MDIRFFSCLVLSFLFGKTVTTEAQRFNFGQCELSGVSLRELKDYFGAIRETVQTQDNRTDVLLLKESVLQDVPHDQNKCSCGEETHRRFKLILDEYKKLDNNIAAIKALGEMDLLFAWMEGFKS